MDNSNESKLLIVDDVPDAVNLVKLILARKFVGRLTITTAASGREGLIAAEREQLDLIIVRIMLADMTGYEVCRRLKATPALRHIPVLLQAALTSARAYPEAQRAGAAGYLEQPFHPQDLIAACDAALRGDVYYPPLADSNQHSRD
jgi:CheY-like chemotaxis protein